MRKERDMRSLTSIFKEVYSVYLRSRSEVTETQKFVFNMICQKCPKLPRVPQAGELPIKQRPKESSKASLSEGGTYPGHKVGLSDL